MTNKRSGFVGIIGQPNVGKSTLLNYVMGEKLAGVSSKPQTTRQIVRGILSRPEGQIIFLDTPGLHQPKDKIGGWMVSEVEKSFKDLDLLYFMVKPKPPTVFERHIIDMAKATNLPTILLINQIDLFKKSVVLPLFEEYRTLHDFKEMIPISAKEGMQVDLLLENTFKYLPEADPYFPEDQISDQSERFIVSELIREKLYHFTQKEIPYSTAVVIDSFKERNEKITDIEASIIIERDSQKHIVVGKNGAMMKQIGIEARIDIEKFLGKQVYLKLWVKTIDNWKSNNAKLKELGYR